MHNQASWFDKIVALLVMFSALLAGLIVSAVALLLVTLPIILPFVGVYFIIKLIMGV